MLIIGLTGGICSGKSTVASLFSQLAVPVIDADVIARELVEPGEEALQEIVDQFGTRVLDKTGKLDRTKLRDRIFSHESDRKKLEAILHPRIRERMDQLTGQLDASYCIQVIPLLTETSQTAKIDRILVIDSSEAEQRNRLRLRDDVTEDQIQAILASQAARQQRLKIADDIIINNGSKEDLHEQVMKLHALYMRLSQNEPDDLHSQHS